MTRKRPGYFVTQYRQLFTVVEGKYEKPLISVKGQHVPTLKAALALYNEWQKPGHVVVVSLSICNVAI